MSDASIKGPGYRVGFDAETATVHFEGCLLYTSPSPRD